MKILHVIPSIHPESGGPARAVVSFANLAEEFATVEIASTTDGYKHEVSVQDIQHDTGLKKNINIHLFPFIGSHSRKYSRKLQKWLKEQVQNYDFVHLHAAFSLTTTLSARTCRKQQVPYVFRPLGTLSPYSFKAKAYIRKKIYFALFEKKTLRGAARIHVTSNQEARDIEKLTSEHINATRVQIPTHLHVESARSRHPGMLRLGVMARIHPKKNLEGLFKAIQSVQSSADVELQIAGTGPNKYIKKLKKLAKRLGIKQHIVWEGFILDERKPEFFDQIDYFVLPSYHENFGYAVVESLSYGRPVIISNQVDTIEWVRDSSTGFECTTEPSSIRQALQKASDTKGYEYKRMSAASLKMVKTAFSDDAVVESLKELYKV